MNEGVAAPAVRLIRATGRACLRPLRDTRELVRAGLQKICPTVGSAGVNVLFGTLLVAVVSAAGVLADMREQPATRHAAQIYQTARRDASNAACRWLAYTPCAALPS